MARRNEMNQVTVGKDRQSLFRAMVEERIAQSATLPTMSFMQAKTYLPKLEEALLENNEYTAACATQYIELSSILGIRPQTAAILQKRYENSTLRCGFENVAEYASLIRAQLSDNISVSSRQVVEAQLAEAEFCTYL